MYSAISGQAATIIRDEFAPSDPRLRKFSDVVLLNLEAADAVYTADNEIEIYTDGKRKIWPRSVKRSGRRRNLSISSITLSGMTNCGSPLKSSWRRR